MEECSEIVKKKPSRRKCIIAATILLSVFTGYIYLVLTWEQKSDPINESIIRQAAAKTRYLNKEPNELTDEDFAKITSLQLQHSELSDIKLLDKFISLEYLTLEGSIFSKKGSPKWMTFLAKLGILDLSDRTYIDLSPLENHVNLKKLYIKTS